MLTSYSSVGRGCDLIWKHGLRAHHQVKMRSWGRRPSSKGTRALIRRGEGTCWECHVTSEAQVTKHDSHQSQLGSRTDPTQARHAFISTWVISDLLPELSDSFCCSEPPPSWYAAPWKLWGQVCPDCSRSHQCCVVLCLSPPTPGRGATVSFPCEWGLVPFHRMSPCVCALAWKVFSLARYMSWGSPNPQFSKNLNCN